MFFHLRSLFVVGTVFSFSAMPILSQTKQAREPFSINPGRSFSASRRPTISPSRKDQITEDVREAEQLIAQNHLGSRSNLTRESAVLAISGMLRSLDPHSHFYGQSEWKQLLEDQQSGYAGIGASISGFRAGGGFETYVISTAADSSAVKSRVAYGDKIVAVNGELMAGKPTDYVRDKIRGPVGTVVRITLSRAETGTTESVAIRREHVAQPSIPAAFMVATGVGYIQMSDGFTYTTVAEFDAALSRLKTLGMRSLVMDLRGNGGGILDQAAKIAERFLPAGATILSQQGRASYDDRVWKSANATPETMPLVIVVDKNTASASEIVAGALQDHDRAIIVGEKTFGKGLVQSVLNLDGGTGVTLTTGRYLTPSGRSIQRSYSSVDHYDYFNHRDSAIDHPYFEGRTITNRRLIAGDGIHPDIELRTDAITSLRVRLTDQIFHFVRSVMEKNARHLVEEDPRARGNLLKEFVELARISEPALNDIATFNANYEFIGRRLDYNLTLALSGEAGAIKTQTRSDPQVQIAIRQLSNAAALTSRARDASRGPK